MNVFICLLLLVRRGVQCRLHLVDKLGLVSMGGFLTTQRFKDANFKRIGPILAKRLIQSPILVFSPCSVNMLVETSQYTLVCRATSLGRNSYILQPIHYKRINVMGPVGTLLARLAWLARFVGSLLHHLISITKSYPKYNQNLWKSFRKLKCCKQRTY